MLGNGLFILGMARKRKDLNFLGLEINEKVFFFLSFYFILFNLL
jgi:tRNA G46 methylase TrmB